jgi:hypothetical protein
MSTHADPPSGAITYVEYLQREIADRLDGVWTCCGPPIADWPSPWERLLGTRPNAGLERNLEARLREVTAQTHAHAQALASAAPEAGG